MTAKRRPKRSKDAEGRIWRRTVQFVVSRDYGKCHICTHFGAKSADHLIPDTEGGSSRPDNLKAAHGVGSPCPDCSRAAGKPVYCNEIRQYGSVERARRKIEERTGLKLGSDIARAPEGRDWLAADELAVHEVVRCSSAAVYQDDIYAGDAVHFADAFAVPERDSITVFKDLVFSFVSPVDMDLVRAHCPAARRASSPGASRSEGIWLGSTP